MAIPGSVRPVTGIKGMDVVLSNLRKEIIKIKGRSLAGLILSSIIVRRDMEKTSPLVPIDLGNLRASWFTVTSKGIDEGASPNFEGERAAELSANHVTIISEAQSIATASPEPLLVMGFSANYAMWVHEMIGDVNWKREGSGAKFFEASLNRNKNEILRTIQANTYIK